MQNLDTKNQLQNLVSEIYEEADRVYSQLNGVLKCGSLTKSNKDRVLDYVHTTVKSLGRRLSAICNNEEIKPLQPYENDEQLSALFFVYSAIHGPTARSNPILKEYLEDLFYCLGDDLLDEGRKKLYPSWVYIELSRITCEGLDQSSAKISKYYRQRRKDLKKRGRR